MSWNYRIVRRTLPPKLQEAPTFQYGIHECYYDKKGVPEKITTEPVCVIQDSVDELAWMLKAMKHALKKEILDKDHFLDKAH